MLPANLVNAVGGATDARADALREKWGAVCLSSGPADRRAAEAALGELYRAMGWRPPAGCVWLDSLLEGLVAAAVLAHAIFYPSLAENAFTQMSAADPAPQGAAALDPLVEACTRGVRAVRTEVARLFPERWRYDEWRERDVTVETDEDALTAERMHDEIMPRIVGAFALQRPAGYRPRVWKRLVERLGARHITDELLNDPRRLEYAMTIAGRGTLDAGRLAVCEYLSAAGGTDTKPLGPLSELSANCGWWWAFEKFAVLTERPAAIHFDPFGRLHSGEGPALDYGRGMKFYRWRGTRVPAEVIEGRDRMTVEDIEDEWNVELRRVMVELYGQERFLRDSGSVLAHEDEYGMLYRKEFFRDEPLVMVKVRNSTLEPDGTFKEYFLRVPPTVQTAREAVAWSFGMERWEYDPSVET